jgi:hypothetical protein
MSALSSPELQTFALAAVHTAILLALLWLGAWAVFWRGTTTALARLDAELQRQKYQVSASEAESRRLAALVRQLEEKQLAELRLPTPMPPPAPRSQASGFEMAIRMAASGATESELVAACGMSREEASLMLRLHGSRGRSVA